MIFHQSLPFHFSFWRPKQPIAYDNISGAWRPVCIVQSSTVVHCCVDTCRWCYLVWTRLFLDKGVSGVCYAWPRSLLRVAHFGSRRTNRAAARADRLKSVVLCGADMNRAKRIFINRELFRHVKIYFATTKRFSIWRYYCNIYFF